MKKLFSLILGVVLLVGMTGCVKPYKKEMLVEIQPNQTAFVVPLEGKTKANQASFMSLEYLEENKVATKRVTLPQRFLQQGRAGWNGRWIPTAKVILVDRKPVTREWTQDQNKGTSNANEAIDVESKDSIGFSVGVNITALISEEDASRFLYNYAGAPLTQIVDQNVRGFATSILSREFGARNLKECKADKKIISEKLLTETREEFRKMGISITNIGLVGGLTYEDKEIQESINKAYMAEMAVEEAEQNKLRQDKVNEMNISMATAERQQAEEFAKAQEAMVAKVRLEIEKIKAEAEKIKAEKWNGELPEKIVPTGASFLFNDN